MPMMKALGRESTPPWKGYGRTLSRIYSSSMTTVIILIKSDTAYKGAAGVVCNVACKGSRKSRHLKAA